MTDPRIVKYLLTHSSKMSTTTTSSNMDTGTATNNNNNTNTNTTTTNNNSNAPTNAGSTDNTTQGQQNTAASTEDDTMDVGASFDRVLNAVPEVFRRDFKNLTGHLMGENEKILQQNQEMEKKLAEQQKAHELEKSEFKKQYANAEKLNDQVGEVFFTTLNNIIKSQIKVSPEDEETLKMDTQQFAKDHPRSAHNLIFAASKISNQSNARSAKYHEQTRDNMAHNLEREWADSMKNRMSRFNNRGSGSGSGNSNTDFDINRSRGNPQLMQHTSTAPPATRGPASYGRATSYDHLVPVTPSVFEASSASDLKPTASKQQTNSNISYNSAILGTHTALTMTYPPIQSNNNILTEDQRRQLAAEGFASFATVA